MKAIKAKMTQYYTQSLHTMFKISDHHEHKLKFRIDKDAPPEYMKRWEDFKSKCESGDNKDVVEEMRRHFELPTNKVLPYLDRNEGGLGGDDNHINKQIRFRDYAMWSELPRYVDNDIVMDEISNTETDKWTYDELDDLIQAFEKVANRVVQGECVRGCIEMVRL